MKPLISIISCLEYARNGVNQAQRDTWLKRSPIEYRFFVGDVTAVETCKEFEASWEIRGCRYTDKSTHIFYTPYEPLSDEVVVPAPDDYKHISYKTRESHRWALRNGFDFVLQVYADLYVDVERFAVSNMLSKMYCGSENGGFCLNKEALEITSNAQVTAWYDDGWVRDTLRNHGINMEIDGRFGAMPNYPTKNNNLITSHLYISPDVHTPEKMYEIEKASRA